VSIGYWLPAPGYSPKRWIGLVAVLTLASLAILLGRPHFSNASRPVRGITNPLVAMQGARNVSDVDTILSDAPSPDREVMRIKQYAGFGFIGGYAALFVLMGMMLVRHGRVLAIAAAALGLLAAVADLIASIDILRLLDVNLSHTTQPMIDAIRYPSLIKWTLLSIALGLWSVLLWRTGLRVIGALSGLSALLGLYGVLYDQVGLQRLVYVGTIALVGLAILYFRPRLPQPRRSA
jgi:hypothetical protein